MADALLQTLTIKLNAEVGNTKRKLKDVATSVEQLEEIGKKTDWSVFEQIRTNLEGIAKIDFSNVANSLKDVVTAMKALGISAKQVKDMPIMSSPKMEDEVSSQAEEKSWNLQDAVVPFTNELTSGLQSANAQFSVLTQNTDEYKTVIDVLQDRLKKAGFSLGQISYVMAEWKHLEAPTANFDELLNVLEELGFSANKVNEILASIGSSNGFGNWEKELKECGVTASEVSLIMKDLFQATREPIDFTALEKTLIRLGFSAEQAKAELEKLGKPTELEVLKQKLTECGLNGQQLKVILEQINQAKADPVNFEQLKNTLTSLGFTADQADDMIKKLGNDSKKAGDSARKGAKGFAKLINSIKRITFYRMVRRAIQLIGQAIQQGVQNVALFDSEFNASMSEIKSSLTYLKDSIGAFLTPLIEMLQPFITLLIDGLAGAFNKIGEAMSAMAGKDTFIKAKKGVEDYAEALKKAKDVSLGIDELNVVKQDDNTANFETAEVEDTATNRAMAGLGEVINELIKIITDLGSSLLPTIFNVLQQLLPPIVNVLKAVMPILNTIVTIATKIISIVLDVVVAVLVPVLNLIADVLNILAPLIDNVLTMITDVLGAIMPIITSMLQGVINSIVTILVPILNFIVQTINTIMTFLRPIIDDVIKPLSSVLKDVYDIVSDLSQGILSWIFDKLKELLEFFSPLLDILRKIFEKLGGVLKRTFGGKGTVEGIEERWQNGYQVGDLVGTIVDGLKLGVNSIKNLFTGNRTPQYATGGFPEDGFFYANHSELVGQFSNGKTAVANNEQITEGIYRAVKDAMSESNAGVSEGKEVVVKVEIDGREIAKTVKKYELQDGNAGFMGGYFNG